MINKYNHFYIINAIVIIVNIVIFLTFANHLYGNNITARYDKEKLKKQTFLNSMSDYINSTFDYISN